ncbi:MAG: hypothetical protein NUW12_09810 [Firmicutes bacterium]|nr:hypothetical protein [Bacillota bacterium]MDH7496283.1 hypothetical protein [Bacillota bacterium]
MSGPSLRASLEAKKPKLGDVPRTLRVLIHMSGANALMPAMARFVLTSASGAPFAEVRLDWEGAASDDEAALRAILEALRMAKRYRAQCVVVYIDNEFAASIASGEAKAPPALVGLALQIRALAHAYRAVTVRTGMPLVAPVLPHLGGHAWPDDEEGYAHGRSGGSEREARQWIS